MGEVFRARDSQLGRDVAIKVLPERFASDPSRLTRFAREARAASALNHPNIITIHEIGETRAQPYIVMEYVDGPTLREVIGNRPLPVKRVLDLGAQLADGLARAHDAGIVHRDLKPENVMVRGDGVLKILDFGLATPAPGIGTPAGVAASDAETRSGAPKTASGAIVGTVGYMAPEQARGGHADHRADQFAAGAILYEMATGRRAFHRDSAVQTLADIIERDPEPIDALNPGFPAPARWAIERCLAKEAGDRYASTHDLARELRTIREHLGETAGSGASVRHPPARRRRRIGPWQAVAFLALVVAGIVAGPPAWRAAHVRLVGPRLPEVLRVAVLPPDAADQSRSLQQYIIWRLAALHHQDGRLSVIPASEILDAACRTPSEAVRAVRATLAVEITVTPNPGGGLQVTVALADSQQVLTSDVEVYEAVSPERVAEQVVRLLKGQLGPGERTTWAKGAPTAPGVDVLYAQALQKTPYQQARTAADRHDQEQNLREAINLYNKAIDAQPDYAAARAGLGEAYLRLYYLTREAGLLALAENSLKRALQGDDTRPAAWISLGMLYTARGDAAGAQDALRKAIQRDPSGGDAHRELGAACERAGLGPQAEAAFREALRLQPDSWTNHNYLGRFLLAAGRFPDAEREFLAALEQVPDNARVLANLGGLYIGLQRWDDAGRVLNRALAVNPAFAPALSNMGTLLYAHHRDYERAESFYARATEATPRDYRLWYNLGLARSAVPRLEAEAPAAYARAASLLDGELEVDPGNPRLLVRLADCHAILGHAEKTRELIALALQHQPSPDDVRIAAKAEEQIGHREAALGLLRRAFDAGLPVSMVEEASPTLAELRKDPRYAALVRAVGSRTGRSPGQVIPASEEGMEEDDMADFYVTLKKPKDPASVGTDPSEKTFTSGQRTVTFQSEVDADYEIIFHDALGANPPAITVRARAAASVTINPQRAGRFPSNGRAVAYKVCPVCQTEFADAKRLPDYTGTLATAQYSRPVPGEPIIIIG